MAINDAATLVIGAGNYFTAPVGTDKPADLRTVSTPWENVGHTSLQDIFSASSEGGDATVLGTLQNKALRTTYSARTESFGITVMQWDTATLKLYYGSNAVVLGDGSLGVPQSPVPTTCAFLAVYVDGANVFGIHAPKVEIFRGDDLSISDTESLAGLPLKISPMIISPNDWAYSVTPLDVTDEG